MKAHDCSCLICYICDFGKDQITNNLDFFLAAVSFVSTHGQCS